MSVLVEAISVVVEVRTLEAKYQGGCAKYKQDCPNRTFCSDRYLTRVGFMTPADVQQFVAQLENKGLVFIDRSRAKDIAVVDQFQGFTVPCDWLDGGRHQDGYSAVWYSGTIPGFLSVPVGWTPEQSSGMTFTSDAEVNERLIRLQASNRVDTLLDFKTGKEVYLGRVYQRET